MLIKIIQKVDCLMSTEGINPIMLEVCCDLIIFISTSLYLISYLFIH